MNSIYLGFIGVLIVLGSILHSNEINKKNNLIISLQTELSVKTETIKKLDEAIESQNEITARFYIDRDRTLKQFEDYKKLPPKIKYKYIYKTVIKDVNINDGSCDNVKIVTDNIKHINLNKL